MINTDFNTMTITQIDELHAAGKEFAINDGKIVKAMDKGDINSIKLIGKIVAPFAYSRSYPNGESLFTTKIETQRLSGTVDVLNVVVSAYCIDSEKDYFGKYVVIDGRVYARNRKDNDNKLVISVFADCLELYNCDDFEGETNDVWIEGCICKEPTYRVTPLGRQICDFILASNTRHGKSNYIPCVSWGRMARFTESLSVGTKLLVKGRLQSREYTKRIGDTEETRTAYELSVSTIIPIHDEN